MKTLGNNQIVVQREQAGRRLDNFLLAHCKGVPRSRVYQMVRRGEVRVNGRRMKVSYRLQGGECIRLPPLYIPQQPDFQPGSQLREQLAQSVLYEDAAVWVVNKPAGLAVHSGSGHAYGVIDVLYTWEVAEKPKLVHRLDRHTSGCLLIAKNLPALRALQEQLRNQQMVKSYHALLAGEWQESEHTVQVPLRTNRLRGGEYRVEAHPQGKFAQTRFLQEQLFPAATLVRVYLLTGRTHQIRVHACCLGYPIAGDRRYGEREQNQQFRTAGLHRLFLHASGLSFFSPDGNKRVSVKCPLPRDLQSVLQSLADGKSACDTV